MITRIQSAFQTTGATNAQSVVVTFGSNLTVGNTVICAAIFAAATQFRVSGNPLPVMLAVGGANATGPTNVAILYGKVTSAATAFTISNTTGTNGAFIVAAAEYKGTNITLEDANHQNTGSNVNPATGALLASTKDNRLVVAAFGQRTTNGTVADITNWLNVANLAWGGSGSGSFLIPEQHATWTNTTGDRTIALVESFTAAATPTAASITGTGATSVNNAWCCIIAQFKEVMFSSGGTG